MTHKLWGVSSTWPKRAKWQLKKKNYGKIILENGDGGNRPNETAIEAWLLDYEKLMMNKDTTSQEAIYQVGSRIELPLRLIQPLRIDCWSTKYQFESHNSFWEHIQTLASFAIPTTPTQEFVVECDHSSDLSGYRRILWSVQKVINKKSAGSFHHALVGRPFKRKITIPNGDYQFYHW